MQDKGGTIFSVLVRHWHDSILESELNSFQFVHVHMATRKFIVNICDAHVWIALHFSGTALPAAVSPRLYWVSVLCWYAFPNAGYHCHFFPGYLYPWTSTKPNHQALCSALDPPTQVPPAPLSLQTAKCPGPEGTGHRAPASSRCVSVKRVPEHRKLWFSSQTT